jgi:predicted ATP-dependent endonuclease of OLD family
MKLEYLYIDGYKGLKRLKLQFKEQTGVVPVDFLIGCNGSGKSSVLEAVGLIFTRIMQNELPGFIFELKYRMPDGTGIYVKPQKKGFCDASGRRRKLYVELEKNGKKLAYVGLITTGVKDQMKEIAVVIFGYGTYGDQGYKIYHLFAEQYVKP